MEGTENITPALTQFTVIQDWQMMILLTLNPTILLSLETLAYKLLTVRRIMTDSTTAILGTPIKIVHRLEWQN